VIATAAAPRAGIAPGRVAGLRQSAVGLRAGREVARLDLEMSVAAPDPHDRIQIDGDPPLDVLIAVARRATAARWGRSSTPSRR